MDEPDLRQLISEQDSEDFEVIPRVSILLPVFDAARVLPSCLRSLQRQSLRSWQCVLVDDGSSDGSLVIAREFAAADSRIQVISTSHRGLVDALNRGLDACKAPIVARMDADDWMHHERLQLQCETLESSPELCAVGAHVRIFPRAARAPEDERALPGEADRVRTGRFGYEAWLNAIVTPEDVARNALIECPIAHPTLAIRRDTLARHGYRDMGWPEDYDLVLRLLEAEERLAVVARRLLGWRDDETRLSRQSPRYSLERFAACKAMHLSRTLLRGHQHFALWGYGRTGRLLTRALRELGLTPSRIVDVHPRRLGQKIQGAEVIAPEALETFERAPLVISVAGEGPRAEIRGFLAKLDYLEGRDFACTA